MEDSDVPISYLIWAEQNVKFYTPSKLAKERIEKYCKRPQPRESNDYGHEDLYSQKIRRHEENSDSWASWAE